MAEPMYPTPSDWSAITLEASVDQGHIISVDSGGTPSTRAEELWDGEIPWLTPKEVARGNTSLYVSKTERTITNKGVASSAAKVLPPQTVLLTKRAPVGCVALNAVPMATNQGFLCFQCGPELDPLFLATWMRVNLEYLLRVSNGSTYRELYKSDLFEFCVAVPDVREQREIVKAVSAIRFAAYLGTALGESVTDPCDLRDLQDDDRVLFSLATKAERALLSGQVAAAEVLARVAS